MKASQKISTLVDLLYLRALENPHASLYTFLAENEKEQSYTYQQLDEKARSIAALLQKQNLKGERALLLYAPGLDYIAGFFGCLYAGVIAVPAYPPDPYRLSRTLPRLQSIVKDSGAKIILATKEIEGLAKMVFAEDPILSSLKWITTDHLSKNLALEWKEPEISSSSLAFLQYTSGSTGLPKGVMVSHGNLLHNLKLIRQAFEIPGYHEGRGVSWLPPYHDMGLIGGILEPLYAAGSTLLLSPLTFLQKPYLWLKAISDYRGTISGGPNFAYEMCLRKITPEQRSTLDLSHWSLAFCGAEPIRPQTLEKFAEVFAECGFKKEAFYPCYGLAEATLIASGGKKSNPPVLKKILRSELKKNKVFTLPLPPPIEGGGVPLLFPSPLVGEGQGEGVKTIVGCGNVLPDEKLLIVNPESLKECSPGEVGEIWVSGPSIAQGYWKKEELSEKIFRAHLNTSPSPCPSPQREREEELVKVPFLRTGDLGFMQEGELFVTDRLKDLIIIRGQNHYPHDLEIAAEKSHAALRPGCGAAFSVEEEGEERLVIVQELDRIQALNLEQLDFEEILTSIRQAVAQQHEVEIYAMVLIKAGSIPKTSSGKISRYACKQDFLEGSLEVIHEWRRCRGDPMWSPNREGNADGDIQKQGRSHRIAPTNQDVIKKESIGHEQIQNWLTEKISQSLSIDPASLDIHQPFSHYGLDSKELVGMSGDLETFLGRSFSPILLWQYPTIEALAGYLAGEDCPSLQTAGGQAPRPSPAGGKGERKLNLSEDPIAVIGMACRFPQANDPEAFWKILSEGVDAITEVPSDRWEKSKFYHSEPATQGKMNTKWGGFIDQAGHFDAPFFGISPREATRMDPQQRLLLEVSWQALEDAGLPAAQLAGTPTGIFVGISSSDYSKFQWQDPSLIDAYAGTGNAHSIAANRLSYFFDFRGPSVAIDTACSSSLVAVHLACQSLKRGETSLALAAGVNLILTPEVNIAFSQARMMSPEGRCKTFDDSADGYVRGEGCAVLVLKSLSQALKDGDQVLAVIRGSAVNQDGRSNGLTAPNGFSQQQVIREALQDARVLPQEISYVETHGTGTPLGDPIEIEALGNILKEGREQNSPCLVGSVKTNIGHLEAAAGIAGLLKVILSLQKGEIPAHLHFKKINRHMKSIVGTGRDLSLLVIPTQNVSWPKNFSRKIAGVSSFGFGGTNAHSDLEEAFKNPDVIPAKAGIHLDQVDSRFRGNDISGFYLLKLSTHSENAVRALASQYQNYLEKHGGEGDKFSLADFCFTANTGRNDFEYRGFVLASSFEDLKTKLSQMDVPPLPGPPPPGGRVKEGEIQLAPRRKPKIAFLFTGQGSQFVGMGKGLYETEPLFRKILDHCDEILKPLLEKSLLSVLYPSEGETSPIDETAYTQPALFALEYALSQLLISWGIQPQGLMGHSVGEYVAACLAGVMKFEDALRLIAVRGALMQSLPKDGSMLAVVADEKSVAEKIKPYLHEVSIAAVNGPRSIVVSGKRERVEFLEKEFQKEGVATQALTVSHAFHSPLMDPILKSFEEKAGQLQYQAPQITLVSNLTGKIFNQDFTLSLTLPHPSKLPAGRRGGGDWGAYWARHLREAVRFSEGLQALVDEGFDCFVEIGPQPILTSLGKKCASPEQGRRASPEKIKWVTTLRKGKEDRQTLLSSLGEMYLQGFQINWKTVSQDALRPCQKISLPTYPFERERYWMESSPSLQTAGGQAPRPSPARGEGDSESSPLLGYRLPSASPGFQFENILSLENFPYLKDHKVQSEVILPATAYLEMAFEGFQKVMSDQNKDQEILILNDFILDQALFLSEDQPVLLQTLFTPEGSSTFSVQTFSFENQSDQDAGKWKLHSTVKLQSKTQELETKIVSISEIKKYLNTEIATSHFYEQLRKHGLEYGPAFQGIQKIWRKEGEALVEIELPLESAAYQVHPALLDAALQSLAAALPSENSKSTYIPISIDRVTLYSKPSKKLWSHVKLKNPPQPPFNKGGLGGILNLEADLFLYDEEGRVIAEIQGLRLRPLSLENAKAEELSLDSWLYEVEWKKSPQPPFTKGGEDKIPHFIKGGLGGILLVFMDSLGVGEKLCEKLEARGQTCMKVSSLSPSEENYKGVIFLRSLNDYPSPLEASTDLLHLIQSLGRQNGLAPPRLWIATRGVQALHEYPMELNLNAAPLWGLGKTLALEHSEWNPSLVDLSFDPGDEELDQWVQEILDPQNENQIVYRGSERFVARLVRFQTPPSPPLELKGRIKVGFDTPCRLEIGEAHTLEDLSLRKAERTSPQSDEVEIQVHASALNFSDVMKALGLYPGLPPGPVPIGIECSGVITSLGEQVKDLKVGDEVIAIAPFCFGRFVTTHRILVVKKPAHLSFEEAATIPITFLTADYALKSLGQLQKGEKVLIHAGAGGVGLAAIQIAKQAGAEIFATAGSAEKRDYLKTLGVEHVMDSRSLAFADEILKITEGKGVDLVLNSLPGEFIQKSLSVLAPYGRFLEIGKTDIYQNNRIGLLPFQKNLSYFAIDLDRMIRERTLFVRSLFVELIQQFENKNLLPLPHKDFPLEESSQAFRYMAQRKNIGKVVITIPDYPLPLTPSLEGRGDGGRVSPDSTYLITGGLGGLGFEVAKWLCGLGAKHLLLSGRSPLSQTGESQLKFLQGLGAQVSYVQADVSKPEEVKKIFDEMKNSKILLGGIFHCAGILEDGFLLHQTPENFQKVFAPKVAGSWNLHEQSLNNPSSILVLFSSIASVLGSPGQGNYAAANSYLDSLSTYRHSLGLPSLTIHWGPWAEVGMAARSASQHLEQSGLKPLRVSSGLKILETLLRSDSKQKTGMDVDWNKFKKAYPESAQAFLSGISVKSEETDPNTGKNWREELSHLASAEQQPLLEVHIQNRVARVLGIDPQRLDLAQSLNHMGLDSLMAIELKNEIEMGLGITLSMATLIRGPSIQELAQQIVSQLNPGIH